MNSRIKSSIPFVGLHAHSVAGSPFDALGYPPEHMDFAYENGMNSLAITDHGNMFGVLKFFNEAKKQGIKPIIGCEAYVAANSRFDKHGKENRHSYHSEDRRNYHNHQKQRRHRSRSRDSPRM